MMHPARATARVIPPGRRHRDVALALGAVMSGEVEERACPFLAGAGEARAAGGRGESAERLPPAAGGAGVRAASFRWPSAQDRLPGARGPRRAARSEPLEGGVSHYA